MIKDVVLTTHYLSEDNLVYVNTGGKGELDSTYQVNKTITIPDGYEGEYFIFNETDADNQIFEYDEIHEVLYNNVSIPTPVFVKLSPYSDLEIDSISSLDTLTAGDKITVNWTVMNNDSMLTNAVFNDKIYISTLPLFEIENSTLLKTVLVLVDTLKTGKSYSKTAEIKIPITVSGRKYIHIVTDADNNIFEYEKEDNNTLGKKIFVKLYPSVDLLVKSDEFILQDSIPWSGAKLNVSWKVKNIGEGITRYRKWYDELYLSTDSILDNDDIHLTNYLHIGKLEPDQTYNNTDITWMPNGIEGDYYIILKVGRELIVDDVDPLNNIVFKPITIQLAPYPDSEITSLVVSKLYGKKESKNKIRSKDDIIQVTAGQPAKINWSVTNNGTAPTGNEEWYDAVYLSADTTKSADDILLYVNTSTNNMEVGTTYEVETIQYMPEYANGLYYVILKTDIMDNMFEISEDNNIAYLPIKISVPKIVDLIVTNITIPDSSISGEDISVEYTVKNIGINYAEGFLTDGVYLSLDKNYDLDDALVGFKQYFISLDPEEEKSFSVKTKTNSVFRTDKDGSLSRIDKKGNTSSLEGELPGLMPGDYHALVRVDMKNNIREDDILNNTAHSTSTVNVDFAKLNLGDSLAVNIEYGQSKYYKMEVNSTNDLLLELDKLQKDDAPVELYVGYNRIPMLYDFDFSSTVPFSSKQEILIPNDEPGVYYIKLFSPTVPNGNNYHTCLLSAKELPFSMMDISPTKGGSGGIVTTTIRGAAFTDSMQIFLKNQNGDTVTEGMILSVENSTLIKARFRLTKTPLIAEGLALGLYSVVLSKNDGEPVSLDNVFQIEPINIEFSANRVVDPENLRRVEMLFGILPAIPALHKYIFKNTGNVDIPYARVNIKMSENIDLLSAHSDKFFNSDDFGYTQNFFKYEVEDPFVNYDKQAYEIPFLVKDLAPEEYSHAYISFTDYTGVAVTSAVDIECYNNDEFIERFESNIQKIRSYILLHPERFETDLVVSAYDFNGLRDSLYVTAKKLGVIDSLYIPVNLDVNNLNILWEEVSNQNLQYIENIIDGSGDFDTAISNTQANGNNKLTLKEALAFGVLLPGYFTNNDQRLFADRIVGSVDPNELNGPAGYDKDRYVKKGHTMNYSIQFENDPNQATAPASIVHVRQKLSDNVDAQTFRVKNFGFGKYQFQAPENIAYHTERIDLRDSLGIYIDYVAGIDVYTREIFFEFKTIDPETGTVPIDPMKGFLAINDSLGSGQGYVTYSILQTAAVVTGDTVYANARIKFDSNDYISTPKWHNVIDAHAPISSMDSISCFVSGDSCLVKWHGNDDYLGSGIDYYDIYMSHNDSAFSKITTADSSVTDIRFHGIVGDKYKFYSLAIDNVGYCEPDKNNAEIEFVFTGANTSPKIIIADTLSFEEDHSYQINLDDYVTYENGNANELIWSIKRIYEDKLSKVRQRKRKNRQDSVWVNLDGSSRIATFNSQVNYYGINHYFEFSVKDSMGLFDIDTVAINIIPVNDLPEIISYSPQDSIQIISEMDSLDFEVNAIDVDNDSLHYRWFINSEYVNIDTSTFKFLTNYQSSGSHDIKCIISDNGFKGNTKYKNISRSKLATIFHKKIH